MLMMMVRSRKKRKLLKSEQKRLHCVVNELICSDSDASEKLNVLQMTCFQRPMKQSSILKVLEIEQLVKVKRKTMKKKKQRKDGE